MYAWEGISGNGDISWQFARKADRFPAVNCLSYVSTIFWQKYFGNGSD